jgi:hypothetical protein
MLSIPKLSLRKSVSLDEMNKGTPKRNNLLTTGKKPRSNYKLLDNQLSTSLIPNEQFLKIYCRIRPWDNRNAEKEECGPIVERKQIYEVIEGNKAIRINMD